MLKHEMREKNQLPELELRVSSLSWPALRVNKHRDNVISQKLVPARAIGMW